MATLETISLCVNEWALACLKIVTYKLFIYKMFMGNIIVMLLDGLLK